MDLAQQAGEIMAVVFGFGVLTGIVVMLILVVLLAEHRDNKPPTKDEWRDVW